MPFTRDTQTLKCTFMHLDASAVREETSNSEDECERLPPLLPAVHVATASNETSESVPVAKALLLTKPLHQKEALVVHPGSPELYETPQLGHPRPEYLYASASKPTANSSTGIFLKTKNLAVYICRIDPDSLFSKSNLRVGDRVIAINGVSFLQGVATKAAKLIKAAKRTVSITVWNRGGTSDLVSNSVQKPSPSQKLGIVFKNHHGALQISRINPMGLCGDSPLLMPKQRCLLIDGISASNMQCEEAARIVEARDFVTIVSRPNDSSAIVLACEDDMVGWSSFAFGVELVTGSLRGLRGISSC